MANPKSTARTLLRANRKNGYSWRQISKHGYNEDDVAIQPGINPTTLCRFAKTKGAWMPKDIEILKLLGLHHEKQSKPRMIADISSDELLNALNNRAELIPTYNQAALNQFIRACKAASKARKARAS